MPNRVTYTFVVSDKFSAKARSIAKRTKEIGRSFQFVNRTAKVAGRGVAGAFGVMKAGAIGLQATMAPMIATVGAAATAFKAFTVGAGFQEALADLGAITGATGKDLSFLRSEALRLGKASGIGAKATLDAFTLVASAKPELLKNSEALASMTEQVILLSNASGIDLSAAATVAAESMNQFGVGAEQAARFVNVLAAGSKLGSSLVGQTGQALVNVAVVAKTAGLTFEETNATLQALADGGIKGSIAGRQLKGVLLSLEASANKKLRPSVVGINSALSNLAALQLDNVQATKLFGRENIAAGQTLSSRVDMVSRLTRELTGTNIAEEQAAVRLSTVNARMRKLSATIANKAIVVFERLTPSIENMANQFTAWLDTIQPEDLSAFVDGLKDVLSVITSIAGASAAAARFLGPVIKAGANLTTSAAAGLSDLGTLLTGGELDATTSASFRNAQRIERSRTDVNVLLNDPGGAVDSVKSVTSGKVSGLNVGVNMVAAEGA